MMSVTHNFFSVGLCLYLASLAPAFTLSHLLLAGWVALSTGFVIDALGHSRRGGRSVRSWTTHSVVTAPLWGASIGLVTVLALSVFLHGFQEGPLLGFAALLGVASGYSHLLLDSMTEGGVYGLRRRVALAHHGNRNPVLNLAFLLLGVVLGLAGLGLLPLIRP